jgi:hypothetical protein
MWGEGMVYDRDVVIAAMRSDGEVLAMVNHELRSDPEVVRAAVDRTPHAIQWATGGLREDPAFVRAGRPYATRLLLQWGLPGVIVQRIAVELDILRGIHPMPAP